MIPGIDYSFGRPGGAAIAAAGYKFAVRYVPYPGDGGKGLTAVEKLDLDTHGIAIVMVFESTAGRMFDGAPAGRFDARRSVDALAALGFPADRPVYFACDVDIVPGQFEYVDDYLLGCSQEIGLPLVGVYGEYDVIERCVVRGTATWLWQTYAWSGGRKHPARHIWQYNNGLVLNGAAVDLNEAYGTDYGQHPVEDDMGLTEDEKLAIFAGGEETMPDPNDPNERILIPREERLVRANSRIKEAAEGRAPSVRDLAAGSHKHANGSGSGVAQHDHNLPASRTGGVATGGDGQ